ncbi:Transposase IS4 [Popillia japonica]|uniref:Transposase IS4 n=1 Tax=Popillia japonica TaxID=7064 RepID=A0AAW1LAN4_POPJA
MEKEILPYNIRDGANVDIFAACDTPTDVFITLLEPALENIIYESNMQNGKVLNLKKPEILAFLGINLFMGYHILPCWKHYWIIQEDLYIACVAKLMPRNSFGKVLQNLYVWIIRHFQYLINMKQHWNGQFYKCSNGPKELSIHESMIIFKKRISVKQYNTIQPIKRGYKFWLSTDQNGYMLGLDLFQGKNEKL